MKHIFVVHSPITYLSALGVIQSEKLKKENILIISESFHLEYEPIPITQVRLFNPSNKFKALIGKYTVYTDLDLQIDNFVINDEFIAYIPVLHLVDRFLITHPKCKKINFIEEGYAAYYKYYRGIQHTFIAGYRWRYSKGIVGIKERLYDIKNIIKGISPSILALPTFYTAYAPDPNITFYGFHEKSHYLGVNRKILSFNVIVNDYKFESKYNLNNSIIWIGDPDIFAYSENKCEIFQSIKDSLIVYLNNNNISNIFVRFHYRENDNQKTQIINFFQKYSIKVIEIKQNAIMEIELMNSRNITLVGICSSLLVYGGIMGHKSLSIYKYLPDSIKKSSNANNEQMEIFWDFVESL